MEESKKIKDIPVVDPYNSPVFDEHKMFTQAKAPRWTQLDLARGFAIVLMILSHCVKGVMAHPKIPDWGIIPVHLMTKFSSSLFIVVFGFSLSVFFLPHVKKKTWGKKRFWMIKRGVELMIWYKLLTVVQMFQYYPKSMIIDTLWFKSMPDFVEILCFYSVALIWLPFVLPLWARIGFISKSIWIVGMMYAGQYLHNHFGFWDLPTLKAIFVEHDAYYTFGQFQRGAIVFLGMLLGDFYKLSKEKNRSRYVFPLGVIGFGLSGMSTFYYLNSENYMVGLKAIAKNVGKHPPELNFMSFSLGGALIILGLCLLVHQNYQKWLKPITYIGQNSLNAFILHIIIIFYFYRYYFGLHYKTTYYQALGLTAACVVASIFILYLWNYLKAAFR